MKLKTPYKIPSGIEKRLQTWNEWAQRQAKDDKTLKPCITISREFGCQAYPLAETLHKRMNYPAAELRGIIRIFHLTPMQSIDEFF